MYPGHRREDTSLALLDMYLGPPTSEASLNLLSDILYIINSSLIIHSLQAES